MLFRRNRECGACGELREELAKVRSRLDTLLLDWETQQDKVHRWMQRTSARARTEEKELAAAPRPLSEGNGGLDPVSAKILARRARRVAGIPSEDESA